MQYWLHAGVPGYFGQVATRVILKMRNLEGSGIKILTQGIKFGIQC